jgi:hypothetical protein
MNAGRIAQRGHVVAAIEPLGDGGPSHQRPGLLNAFWPNEAKKPNDSRRPISPRSFKPGVIGVTCPARRFPRRPEAPTENAPTPRRRNAMAKGQMRSNKEKKKPKAEHNKKNKKGGAAPPASPFSPGQGQAQPGYNPYGKKG